MWIENKELYGFKVLSDVINEDIQEDGSFIVPDGVTHIGVSAFRNCNNLKSITLPESLKGIEFLAFDRCHFLTNIKVPDSVTKIGHDAFFGCENLTRIELSEGVTRVEAGAFDSCEKLTEVVWGDKVYPVKCIDGDICVQVKDKKQMGDYQILKCHAFPERDRDVYVAEKDGVSARGNTAKDAIASLEEKLGKESISTTLYLNEEYRAKLEAFTGRSIEGPDDFADVIWQMVDERLGILPVAKEMSVETELGEIVVREKVDTNYPGVMIDLRGERANDLFEAGMAALATIEFDPETKGIRMDVYQDGDSEERTDSITFENVLKDAVPVKDTVRLNIGHYIDNDFSPSRVTTFLVRIQDLEDYLEQSEDDRTGEEFYQTYDSDEAQVLYEYMSDDGKILDEEVTYCDAFEKDYADYIKRTQMFNPGMSAEQIATKENYYWNVYVNVAEPSLKKEKQRPLVEQIQDAKNVKQEKQNDAGKMAGRGNLER